MLQVIITSSAMTWEKKQVIIVHTFEIFVYEFAERIQVDDENTVQNI